MWRTEDMIAGIGVGVTGEEGKWTGRRIGERRSGWNGSYLLETMHRLVGMTIRG